LIRALLDANVLISAAIRPSGPPGRIIAALLTRSFDLVQDTGKVTGVCRDPADDVVLAAAVEGRADNIVTGDDDLLVLGDFEGIAIVTHRSFLDSITS
jgi:predicted nucleic acid-binding protein